jgi:tRNA threonylcarbamoyladenosine biosynthesis protein TsaE
VSCYRVALGSEDELVAFGAALAAALSPGSTVYLEGELGAGKTTLTRGIARGLGHRGAVKSPTYTLVEPYQHLAIPLYHFDLYRLADPEELEYLGVRDYFSDDALVVVEWPQRGAGILPPPDLALSIGVIDGGRSIALEALGPRGEACLQALLSAGALTGAHSGGAALQAGRP